ncbi:MAG: ABC transporter ATP-binding protein [Actinomycetales bacterium]|nr:ABC transporter ATP-binding protein [Actinomycetales bacterium]
MLFKLSMRYLRPYMGTVYLVIALQVIQTLAALALPTLNADIIDQGVVRADIPFIWRTGAEMLAISALQVACAVSAAYLGARTAMSVGRDLRRDVFSTVQRFGSLELTRFGPPSLITRSTNDVQQIQVVLMLTFTIMVMVPIMLFGGVFMAMRQDAQLSWLLVAIVPVLGSVVGLAMVRMRPLFKQMQARIDTINTVLREQLAGVRVIRAFVRQSAERERFRGANTALFDTSLSVGLWMAFLFPAVQLVVFSAQVGVIWFGGLRIDAGGMEVGSLIAFLNYLMQIFMSVMMATMMFMIVPRGEVSADRVNEVLTSPIAIGTPASPAALPPGALTFAFEDVGFRYPGAESDVLTGVNLALRPGTTTAVVGSTGAGKTTLVNLLPRLLEASSGRLTVDGIALADVDLTALRQRIALVPQRTFLFSGTIASNLRLGAPEASEEQMWAALEASQAAEFVRALGGLEAHVEQGGKNFSGGQRQRLTIARALVRRADLTIFDDSFSALDYSTDLLLRRALRAVLADRAVLIVAQRVATIRGADAIVVLDGGRVVGIGTHAVLMAECETYREIVLSQLSAEEAA